MTQGAPGQTCRPLMSQRRHIADADDFGGGLQRDLATLGPFAIAIRRNVPVFAEPAHALLGPGLSRCHLYSGPVQQARDLPIRHQTSQLAHERNQIVCDRIVAPAGCVQFDAQLQCRVIATVPAQDLSSTSPSLRTMISSRQARRILLRVAAVAAEWDQARARSAPSAINCCFCCSSSGGDRSAALAAISRSILCTFSSATFQRRSSSLATNRFVGSTASYCRRA